MNQTTNDWVLLLDSDEELSTPLISEIQSELESIPDGVCGYEMPRKVLYLGKWINHSGWYPDYKLRLYRKSKGHMGGVDPHEQFILDGEKKKLRNDLLHYSYRDISEQIGTLNRYSEMYASTRKWRPGDFFRMIFRPPLKFLEVYIGKGGILDGIQGFFIAVMMAYSIFARYAKVFERTYGKSSIDDRTR